MLAILWIGVSDFILASTYILISPAYLPRDILLAGFGIIRLLSGLLPDMLSGLLSDGVSQMSDNRQTGSGNL